MASEQNQICHEKQRLQFCLLHSLNNLFQQKDAFTRATLNSIAERLVLDDPEKEIWTPFSLVFKPHHNSVTGNYDINVLIAALEGRGKTVIWHDGRNGASAIDLNDGLLMGIVVNVPVRRYGGLWKSRHWIAVRKIDGVWYNLDSDLQAPHCFKDCGEVREFLNFIINHDGQGLVASAMVFAIQIYVVNRGGPLSVSMYLPLQTLLAALIAVVTLGEEFYLGGVVGAELIIAGLYLVILGKSEESKYLSENEPIYSVSENNDMESTFIRPLLENKLQS